eukprot:gb/GECH01011753.1/.p1 GENE.gb/GECH01011753.1/~~gb/GECH01011753.1/.p1  ORF type:complete len:442 (+),score=151.92 gb/GECH01011753.1/:1-1326(+)
MSSSQFPQALKRLLPYLQRANEIESKSPLVAYYCRTWAAQKGIEIVQSLEEKDEEAHHYLLSLMDRLEQDKNKGIQPDNEEGEKLVITVAMQLFLKADKAEKTGAIDWSIIAKLFYSSSIIMDVVQQFHEMPEDLKDKQRYARWKAAEIQKSLKAGITPTPSGEFENEEEDQLSDQGDDLQPDDQSQQSQEYNATGNSNNQQPTSDSSSFDYHQSNQSENPSQETGQSQRDHSNNDFWNTQQQNYNQTEQYKSNRSPRSSDGNYSSSYNSAGSTSQFNNQPSDNSMFSTNDASYQTPNKHYYTNESSNQEYNNHHHQEQQRQQSYHQRDYSSSSQSNYNTQQSNQQGFHQQHQQQQYRQPSQQRNNQNSQHQYSQSYQQPSQQSSQQSSASVTPTMKKEPTIDEMMTAQKHAKYAVSALQFNDSKTALKELTTALKALNSL